MAKLTQRKLGSLIKEEKAASTEYKKLGLPSIARDEARHAKTLTKLSKTNWRIVKGFER
jgi:hypothetical protein